MYRWQRERELVQIERQLIDEMVAHARKDFPNECCGLLAGQEGHALKLYRMTNVEASPFRFSMDPKEVAQVDKEASDRGWDLMAIYHSHVRSPAYPSDTDVRIAGGTSEIWPEVRYILVSLMDSLEPQVRIFQIKAGVVTEESLEVV
jgi:proteasome lid subunit RPN8/RPN11